jgi:hypothetical protein
MVSSIDSFVVLFCLLQCSRASGDQSWSGFSVIVHGGSYIVWMRDVDDLERRKMIDKFMLQFTDKTLDIVCQHVVQVLLLLVASSVRAQRTCTNLSIC